MSHYFFYIKDYQYNLIMGVTKIYNNEPNRLGWLNYDVVYNPNNVDNSGGGIDAEFVFTNPRFDISKNIESLK